MHIDTPISPVLIAVAVLLLLGLLAWAMRRLRPELTRVQWWVILGLRLGGLASLALLLLNPYAVETLPDPERYRIAVLADLSGSMHATDLGEGQERIEFIQGALDAALEASLINRLQSTAPTELYGFTDSLRALPPEGVEIQPGVTALGTSLESALSEQDLERRLAGLVVLTDGISLQGPPPLEIARAYRQADIPLNIVGVGSSGRTGDVSIALVAKTADPVVGEPLELVASVSNAFSESVTLSWEILTGDELLSSEEVTLPAGESTQISVIHEPERSGLHRYRARLTDVPALDQNPANDSAYAAADVLEPRVMKVLYLSNYLSDTYRFLRQALRSNPDWELHAIQRLNEERFVYAGLDEPEEDGLIGFAYAVDKLFDYSTVVLDTSVIADLDDAGRDALLGYLTRRGGGLLFLGAPQNLPSEMAYLLPVRQSEAMRENFDLALAFTPQPVFSDLAGGTLFRPPHAFLPEGKTAFLGLELARGARASLATRQRDIPILSQQAYGAGRVAYLGTEATWRWRMSSEHGLRQHDLFWTYLLGWLSTGGKPRLELPLQGQLRPVGESLDLDIDVRGADFRPAEDARVRAKLSPVGSQPGPEINLVADPSVPGRYRAASAIDSPGEYRLEYRVDFPDGESLSEEAWFAAAYLGKENTDLVFRERELRDLARITRGNYVAWDELGDLLPLALSQDVATRDIRHYWTRTALFLILIVLIFGAEWLIRRRAGLN